ncbi:retropepsin-like aspartic protease [Chitinophaga rhizosphaerae]|uniref:retropepsin-like aspartic protease n=1 Tax=Chitinophaga rhizosphaerae TaxID=1864947 RepID=UPI000F80B2EA|nr:retropepsin-like aspartic protease [Chitinophaga rhizosphaerae]
MRTCLLTVLCACIFLSSAKAHDPRTEIPFQVTASGHILLKATVSGVEGNFIFDTGAGITVFTKAFFDKLKNTQREDGGYVGFRATGERLDIDLYRVRDVAFGPLKKAEEEVSFLDANLGGIDGIIAVKLLEDQPFTIDFTQNVLRFENRQTLASIRKSAKIVPLQLEQSRNHSLTLFAYFQVNDSLRLQCSLDSGAGKDVFRLNAKYLGRLNVDVSDTARVRKVERKSEFNENFRSSIYITELRNLAVDGEPSVRTGPFGAQLVEGLIYDGIIWISWLGRKITFDLGAPALLVRN